MKFCLCKMLIITSPGKKLKIPLVINNIIKTKCTKDSVIRTFIPLNLSIETLKSKMKNEHRIESLEIGVRLSCIIYSLLFSTTKVIK